MGLSITQPSRITPCCLNNSPLLGRHQKPLKAIFLYSLKKILLWKIPNTHKVREWREKPTLSTIAHRELLTARGQSPYTSDLPISSPASNNYKIHHFTYKDLKMYFLM